MSNKIVTLKDKIGNVILPRTSVNSIIDKESLEIVGNKITSWSGTPSDDKYPSEKLVKITIENKADTSHIHGNISNGGKIGATGNLLVFTGTDGKLDTITTGSNGQVLKLSSGKPTWANEYSYTLPTASSSTLGGVKIGSGIDIASGVISVSTNYQAPLSSPNNATQNILNDSVIRGLKQGTNIDITEASNLITIAATDTTYSAGTGLDLDGTTFSIDDTVATLTGAQTLTNKRLGDLTSKGFVVTTGTDGTLGVDTSTYSLSGHTHSYLPLSGGTLTGTLNSRSITPTANNTYSLGTSSLKFKDGHFSNDVSIGRNLVVTGNLTISGTTTTVNATTMSIADPVITLGGTAPLTSNDGKDRGIEYRWHNGTASKLGFFGVNKSDNTFTFIPDATNNNEVFSGTVGTIKANLSGDVNEITLGKQATGFTVKGGTASRTLTVTANATIAHSTHASGSDNQTISSGSGMNFTSGSGNVTITLGTPSDLTASTSSTVTTNSHSHKVVSTDEGTEGTIVKTGTDGSITAKDKFNLGNKANIFFNSTTNTIDFAFV